MTLLVRVDAGTAPPDPAAAVAQEAAPAPELSPAEREIVAEYRRRFAEYERQLRLIWPRRQGPVHLPDFPVLYPPDLDPVSVDGSLLGSLCFVYALRGWAGIEAVQQAMVDAYVQAARVAGPVNPERLAIRFLGTTRDLVAKLIRHTLADLETRAAAEVTAGLAVSRTKLEEARKTLGIEELEISEPPASPGAGPPVATIRYTFANRPLSTTVHRRLVTIADQMAVLGTLLRSQRLMERRGVPAQAAARANLLESIEVFKRNAKVTGLIIESLQKADVFTRQCPLALLGLSLVGRFTSRLDMEDRLGSVLVQLAESVAVLARTPMGKRVDTVPARTDGEVHLDRTGGPERVVLRAALAGVGKDRGWTPMLHEPTWDALIRTGNVPPGGFGYVVAQQYRAALIEHRVAAEREAAADRRLIGGIQRVAAALSLAGLVLAPFGGVAVIMAATVGLNLTAAAVSVAAVVAGVAEVMQEAAASQLAVDVGISGPDPVAMEHLAELGARARLVHEMTGGIAEQIGEVVLLELVGKVLPVVKLAWTGYGYCLDLQTLLTAPDDEPAAR